VGEQGGGPSGFSGKVAWHLFQLSLFAGVHGTGGSSS
jgi:hypothetical protein